MSKWHGGKGSKQRPTDLKKFNDNWARIFGKKNGSSKERSPSSDSKEEKRTK